MGIKEHELFDTYPSEMRKNTLFSDGGKQTLGATLGDNFGSNFPGAILLHAFG